MPFKSKAQLRKFILLEERGEIPEGTTARWLKETPSVSRLPERVKPMKKSMRLGGGGRFAKLVRQLKNRKVGRTKRGRKMAKSLPGKTEKVKNPASLAAWIGRKKYGKEKFQKMALQARLKKALKK